jgi:hypothetical protein
MKEESTYLNLDILIILIHSVIKLSVAGAVHHISVTLRCSYLIANDQSADAGLNLDNASQLLRRQPLSNHLRIIKGSTLGISVNVTLIIGGFFSATSISHSFETEI